MQWRTILGIVLALIVAIFAVTNVRSEAINYVFGVAYVPLVLIILGSALLGALAVGIPGIMSRMRLKGENRRLRRELDDLGERQSVSQPLSKSSGDAEPDETVGSDTSPESDPKSNDHLSNPSDV